MTANVKLPEVKERKRPVKWCKRCSRKHEAGKCNLVMTINTNEKGYMIFRYTHPKLETE